MTMVIVFFLSCVCSTLTRDHK